MHVFLMSRCSVIHIHVPWGGDFPPALQNTKKIYNSSLQKKEKKHIRESFNYGFPNNSPCDLDGELLCAMIQCT